MDSSRIVDGLGISGLCARDSARPNTDEPTWGDRAANEGQVQQSVKADVSPRITLADVIAFIKSTDAATAHNLTIICQQREAVLRAEARAAAALVAAASPPAAAALPVDPVPAGSAAVTPVDLAPAPAPAPAAAAPKLPQECKGPTCTQFHCVKRAFPRNSSNLLKKLCCGQTDTTIIDAIDNFHNKIHSYEAAQAIIRLRLDEKKKAKAAKAALAAPRA